MGLSHALATTLAVLAMLANIPRDAHAVEVGAVERLSGSVSIRSVDDKTRKAEPNEKIQSGDVIATEAKSEALIKMTDQSTIVLRPNTQFKVNEFKYEQKSSDSALLSVIRGTMRLVSGLIARANPRGVRVTAQTATIGIRGTDFEVAVITEDSADARAGVYNYVHDGETNIQIATGQSLDVKKDQTAFAPEKVRPGEEPLQILAEPPLFLRQGGGFDALIQSLTRQPINIIHQLPPRIH